jgi:predicted TIM-barrel fold metal-dependent hydrolase
MDPKAFCDLICAFGSHRILFGSDSPWGEQKADVERILALPLDDEEKQSIFFKNAQRLLFSATV